MTKPVLAADFDAAQFLRQHWQQSPCLLRGLVPGLRDPLTPDELAGLACEDGAESRLVIRSRQDWQVRFGPFVEGEFQSLPENSWTLLVQAVDLWLDEVAKLGRLFDFIPSWRREDVMVSYATAGGGVAPHFDNYDVFLVQGCGQRLWRIGAPCSSDTPLEDNPELRLLKEFHPTQEYLLETGDVLYIPPGVSHWGESVDDSLCYSIGFRAPSAADVVLGYGHYLAERQPNDRRYEDPGVTDQNLNNPMFGKPGEISEAVVQQVRSLLDGALATDDTGGLQEWFGCHVTAPRDSDLIQPPENTVDRSTLSAAARLLPHAATRLAWSHTANNSILLFCNGQAYPLPATAIEFVSELCAASAFTDGKNLPSPLEDELTEVLLELLNSGALELAEHAG